MEKELNIADILKDKPKGTRLWSPIIGECTYRSYYPSTEDIQVNFTNRHEEDSTWDFHQSGRTLSAPGYAEVCLFPSKAMQDWSKFAWKKGDVLFDEKNGNYCFFDHFIDDKYLNLCGKFLYNNLDDSIINNGFINDMTSDFEKVSDSDAEAIVTNIERKLCGTLNLSTLEIEKHNSQFKDGDIVVLDDDGKSHFKTILLYQSNIDDKYEVYSFLNAGTLYLSLEATLMDDRKARPATDSEKQQLFDALAKENKAWDADKKQIVDLPKKFKVLDYILIKNIFRTWQLHQYAFDNKYSIITVGGAAYSKQCKILPYNDQTAHLLGTTDDWKGGEG